MCRCAIFLFLSCLSSVSWCIFLTRASGSSITAVETRFAGLAVGLQVDVGFSGMLNRNDVLSALTRFFLRAVSLLKPLLVIIISHHYSLWLIFGKLL